MFKLALKSTLAKKRRLFSTALSVMLGVAFLAGTLVFTDTIGRTFDDLFAGIYAETDTYVRAQSERRAGVAAASAAACPSSVVATVAAVPGVADAQAFVGGYAQIVDADGDAIGNPGRGAPTLGMSYVAGALEPVAADRGQHAHRDRARSSSTRAAPTPATCGSATPSPSSPRPALTSSRLVGTARFGSVDSPGGASVAIFDLATAQQVLLGGIDEIDAVMVDAAPGVSRGRR